MRTVGKCRFYFFVVVVIVVGCYCCFCRYCCFRCCPCRCCCCRCCCCCYCFCYCYCSFCCHCCCLCFIFCTSPSPRLMKTALFFRFAGLPLQGTRTQLPQARQNRALPSLLREIFLQHSHSALSIFCLRWLPWEWQQL